MRRNLIDSRRTCHNRLWSYLPPVCAFSVFLLLLILCCMKTFFPFIWLGVFCCFSLHPNFEHECVGLVAGTYPTSASSYLPSTLTSNVFSVCLCPHTKKFQKEPVFLPDALVSELGFCCTSCLLGS